MDAAEKLSEVIAGLEIRCGRKMYSPELKREILEYSNTQVALGVSKSAVAAKLGMNDCTLHRWHQGRQTNCRNSPAAPTGFIEITNNGKARLAKPQPLLGFEIVCPNGFEIRLSTGFESLSLEQLLAAVGSRP